ncbi:flagellar protein FlaG [Pseudomonas sp.]|uniref:flagellar protein FlaG n=1 Tax=Pseudomonas sp. TaxID=306 RepID=UPI00272BE838|nr:flagellar protein FlaG [Pseudomonas sp.]
MDMGILKPVETSRNIGSTESRTAVDSAVTGASSAFVNPEASQRVEPLQSTDPAQKDKLQDALADMQEFVQSVSRDIGFQLDDASGRMVVSITERKTGELIRQIPSEEALQLAESLSEIRSLLFKAEA